MYRTLNSEGIVAILETLKRRIVERFPDASLGKVCAELVAIGRETGGRTARIAMPDYTFRTGIAAAIVGGLVLLAYAGAQVEVKREGTNVYGILQGVESGFNIVALMGAAIFFLVTFEVRWKRRQAMAGLHELRSIVHVIDMHQLTKDPSALSETAIATASSPDRSMSPYAMGRYLDYCAEMLSLAAKVAALYAQSSKDPVVVAAANDIGQLTANLSNKIWQKIALVQRVAP